VRKLMIALAGLAVCGLAVASTQWPARADDAGSPPANFDWTKVKPIDVVKEFPKKGTLHNPYDTLAKDKAVADEGHHIFLSLSCNGCHGGDGGGGMCPPLTATGWIYGRDDDTLFRLVTLGSDQLQKQYGLKRSGELASPGPMPAQGPDFNPPSKLTALDLWKVFAWIRTINPASLKPATNGPPPPVFN
jgi:mono/diheme cytochrome c family protein